MRSKRSLVIILASLDTLFKMVEPMVVSSLVTGCLCRKTAAVYNYGSMAARQPGLGSHATIANFLPDTNLDSRSLNYQAV